MGSFMVTFGKNPTDNAAESFQLSEQRFGYEIGINSIAENWNFVILKTFSETRIQTVSCNPRIPDSGSMIFLF